MIDKIEPYIMLIILLFVIFLQIDSHFLNSKYIGLEMSIARTIVWILITIFLIATCIRSFNKAKRDK